MIIIHYGDGTIYHTEGDIAFVPIGVRKRQFRRTHVPTGEVITGSAVFGSEEDYIACIYKWDRMMPSVWRYDAMPQDNDEQE